MFGSLLPPRGEPNYSLNREGWLVSQSMLRCVPNLSAFTPSPPCWRLDSTMASGSSGWRSGEAAGSSADHASEDASAALFPPPESGLMRGYLGADLPGGKLWFVLSQERLSCFETEHSEEPLGTLRVDEVSSVHATKHGQREFRLRIRSSSADGVEFERRLSQPLHRASNTPGPLSTRSESALSRQSTPCRAHASPSTLHRGASAATAAAAAQCTERSGCTGAERAEGARGPSVWSRFASFWHNVLPRHAAHAGQGRGAARPAKGASAAASAAATQECVLMAHTPFEVGPHPHPSRSRSPSPSPDPDPDRWRWTRGRVRYAKRSGRSSPPHVTRFGIRGRGRGRGRVGVGVGLDVARLRRV